MSEQTTELENKEDRVKGYLEQILYVVFTKLKNKEDLSENESYVFGQIQHLTGLMVDLDVVKKYRPDEVEFYNIQLSYFHNLYVSKFVGKLVAEKRNLEIEYFDEYTRLTTEEGNENE